MKQILLLVFSLLFNTGLLAEEVIKPEPAPEEALAASELTPVQQVMSLSAEQADWAFSGIVSNESGEYYNFYLDIQRNFDQLYGVATLIDTANKQVVFYEESTTKFDAQDTTAWQAGRIFLRFNPINNSWVFGVKNDDGKGFNFKVDMLGVMDNLSAKKQDLRQGVELLISQTDRLNGHLQTGNGTKEQFVTAPKAWFRQVWVSHEQTATHPLTGVLCNFKNGDAFYAVSLQEADALRGAVAGWRDSNGKVVAMSQFVTVEDNKEGNWLIHIPSPKLEIALKDMLYSLNQNHHLIAGLTNGDMPGFCTISQNEIMQKNSQ